MVCVTKPTCSAAPANSQARGQLPVLFAKYAFKATTNWSTFV